MCMDKSWKLMKCMPLRHNATREKTVYYHGETFCENY
ncbi:unnamed protein product [Amoebophrya sp. A120]|nr:unnamed protein product [Amoebophrya sp. A120]|eukprot:GSA120T00023533001.1